MYKLSCEHKHVVNEQTNKASSILLCLLKVANIATRSLYLPVRTLDS